MKPAPCFVLLIASTLATPALRAGDVAYEPFSAYFLDQSLPQSAQPVPPASTGILDYTAGNPHITWKPRAGSLSYSTNGAVLATEGAKLEVDSGGVQMDAPLDLSPGAAWNAFLENGNVGKDGTTLYFSMLYQARNATVTGPVVQRYFALREGGGSPDNFGVTWQDTTFTIAQDTGIPIDGDVHLFVVRIDYRSGNDSVTVFFDPDISRNEASQSAIGTYSRDMAFDEFQFKSQGEAYFIDELRFGTTWESVTPQANTATLSVSAGANGSVHVDPERDLYSTGEEVYIEATAEEGYRFDGWTGDVPDGREMTNPLYVTMDVDRSLTARFVSGKSEFFLFEPGTDPYGSALVDLRGMNETVAGENGWVTRQGHKFFLGDGRPVRFWSATVGVPAAVDEVARYLAKRGLNLVRWHTSLYSNSATDLSDVNMGKVDDLHRLVAAMKDEGIYTKASLFFILGLRIQEEWNLDGYDAAWIAANDGGNGESNYANEAPFALQFVDEDFKNAYKNWVNVLFSTTNPYTGIALKDDPALAMIEVQNEDNLFFWTFRPQRFPEVQRQKFERKFGDWLVAKYGSIAAAQSAWGGSSFGRDDPSEGLMEVTQAWNMTGSYSANPERMADQILFLMDLQRDWYAEMIDYMRNTVGCRQLFTASNWKTSDDTFLLDAEYFTYTAADIIDTHNYFSPQISNAAIFTSVSGGDTYLSVPAINNPRRLPVALKHVENHPHMISETTWVNPSDHEAEAALMSAAYGSLTDLDCFVWFASGSTGWQDGVGRWQFAVPQLGGMFPGAALLYRRYDVREAPTVVREGRSLQAIADKETSLFVETRGWDPTRDPNNEFANDGTGQLDPLATYVGRVELAFDGDADYIHPMLDTYIDHPNRVVTSITGELQTHWGQIKGADPHGAGPLEGQGHMTVNTPRSQGTAGYLFHAGTIHLDNVDITMNNEFGTVLVISLDGKPLSHSTRVLIQAVGNAGLRRWQTTDRVLPSDGTDWRGKEIVSVGEMPWLVDGIDASVTLKGMGTVTQVRAVDANGYPIAALPASNTVVLPDQALYTVVDLAPDGATYEAWEGFSAQQHNLPVGDPAVNADGDRFDNFDEYVLNTNPMAVDGPMLETSGNPSGLRLTFPIRTNDPQVAHRVEVSNDLATWHWNGDGSGRTYTTEVSSQPNGDGTTTYTVESTDALGVDRVYMRVSWDRY